VNHGLRHVGLPWRCLRRAGTKSRDSIPIPASGMLNARQFLLEHIPSEQIQSFRQQHSPSSCEPTNSRQLNNLHRAISLWFSTPLDERLRQKPDLSYVERPHLYLYPQLQRGTLVDPRNRPLTRAPLEDWFSHPGENRIASAHRRRARNTTIQSLPLIFSWPFSAVTRVSRKQSFAWPIPKVVGGLNHPERPRRAKPVRQGRARFVSVTPRPPRRCQATAREHLPLRLNIALVNESSKQLSLRMTSISGK